jgi:hypothetical protein
MVALHSSALSALAAPIEAARSLAAAIAEEVVLVVEDEDAVGVGDVATAEVVVGGEVVGTRGCAPAAGTGTAPSPTTKKNMAGKARRRGSTKKAQCS